MRSDRLGELEESMLGGFGFGQSFEAEAVKDLGSLTIQVNPSTVEGLFDKYPSRWEGEKAAPQHI